MAKRDVESATTLTAQKAYVARLARDGGSMVSGQQKEQDIVTQSLTYQRACP